MRGSILRAELPLLGLWGCQEVSVCPWSTPPSWAFLIFLSYLFILRYLPTARCPPDKAPGIREQVIPALLIPVPFWLQKDEGKVRISLPVTLRG